MRTALVATTHERPAALARVLESVVAQRHPPDELIVADDGSCESTRAVVSRCAAAAPFPVVHSWQPRHGPRVCRSRNLAVARTRCDYIVVIDGDMLLHPGFLAEHAAHARRGTWVQGCRLPLGAGATSRALAGEPLASVVAAASVGWRRRLQAWHAPRAARALRRLANAFIAVKGCNQAFWRDDLVRVNGWDEAMTGWGPEDKELCARLVHAGVARRTLVCAGLAWHLDHPPADRDRVAANRAVLARTLRERRRRCEQGLDAHLEM